MKKDLYCTHGCLGLVLGMVMAGSAWGAVGDAEASNMPRTLDRKLAAFLDTRGYTAAYLPALGQTYGLTLEPIDPKRRRLDELWVHKVGERVPGRTLAECREYADRLGFTCKSGARGIGGTNAIGNMVFWVTERPERVRVTYHNRVMREPDQKEFEARWKGETGITNMFAKGRAEMERMGAWPEDAQDHWESCANTIRGWPGDPVVERTFLVTRKDTMEGDFPVFSRRNYIEMHVSFTGVIRGFEMRWATTERYAKVKTKSIKEAFEELNKGYGTALPVQARGTKVRYDWVYYGTDGIADNWMYPVYTFDLLSAASGDVLGRALIPAVASEYFQDPKRQVVHEGMLTTNAAGQWVAMDEAKVRERYAFERFARDRNERLREVVLKGAGAVAVGDVVKMDAGGEWVIYADRLLTGQTSDAGALLDPMAWEFRFSGSGQRIEEARAFVGHESVADVLTDSDVETLAKGQKGRGCVVVYKKEFEGKEKFGFLVYMNGGWYRVLRAYSGATEVPPYVLRETWLNESVFSGPTEELIERIDKITEDQKLKWIYREQPEQKKKKKPAPAG